MGVIVSIMQLRGQKDGVGNAQTAFGKEMGPRPHVAITPGFPLISSVLLSLI